MGYPIEMIGANTALFSLIGENAIEHKGDELFNQHFKTLDVDCKMMSLNIRQDDLGYFLNGLKDSQIKAAYFETEYWQKVYELLPCDDEEINFCAICDTIEIEDSNYHMRLSLGEAILSLLGNINEQTIMIIGATPEAKSTLFNLCKQTPSKIVLAHTIIEELADMMHLIPNHIEHDIIRIEDNNQLYAYDRILNFTNTEMVCDINFEKDRDKISTKIAELNTKKWSNI